MEQDLVTAVRSKRIINSPINVNLHYPLEHPLGLFKRQLNYMQIATLPFNWEFYLSCDKLVQYVALIIKIKRNWLPSKCSTPNPNFKTVSASKLQESELTLLSISQNDWFQKEILCLQKGNPV